MPRQVKVKGGVASVAWSTWEDVPDCTVELLAEEHGRTPVQLGGVLIGHIEKGSRSWERRTRGKRFVNARGRTPEWHAWTPDERLHAVPTEREDTRNGVLVKLIA